jgi:hypothetical protein
MPRRLDRGVTMPRPGLQIMGRVQTPVDAAHDGDRDAAILELLRARGQMAAEEVAATLDAAQYVIAEALRQLERRRRVVCLGHAARLTGSRGGARWVAVWAAAPDAA